MQEPLVSICCMTYNHENYIQQCLDRIVMQQTTFPFEILVHEDASTDNTANIVKEYESKFPHLFRCIYQSENQFAKQNTLVNVLLPISRGKYIAICEGDDYWTDPYKLQKQVDFLEENPKYSAVGHQTEIIYENYPGKSEVFFNYSKDTLSKKEIIFSNHFHTNAIVFRKDSLMKFDLNNAKHFVEHSLFILISQSGPFKVFPEVMSVYRRHDFGAAGTSTPPIAYTEQIDWIKELWNLLGWSFFCGYHFLSSKVHFNYASYHPEIFNGGLFKRNLYFLKYATLTLLLYPGNMKTVIRLLPKLFGSTKSK